MIDTGTKDADTIPRSPDHTTIDIDADEGTERRVKRRIQAAGVHRAKPRINPPLPSIIIQDNDGTGHLDVPRDLTYSFPPLLGYTSIEFWDMLDDAHHRMYVDEEGESSNSDYGHYDDVQLERRYAFLEETAKAHEESLRKQEEEDEENRRWSHDGDADEDGMQWSGGGLHRTGQERAYAHSSPGLWDHKGAYARLSSTSTDTTLAFDNSHTESARVLFQAPMVVNSV